MILIRIGVTGSHGTGKTTLCKILADTLKIPYIEEQARISFEVLNMQDLDIARLDNDKFSNFQQDVIRRQINEEYKHGNNFISDRTTLCNYAYYKVNTKDAPKIKNGYRSIALNNFSCGYDLVIYIPIIFELVLDGVRNKGEDYRLKVDAIIQNHLYLNPNVYCLQSDGVENRVKELTEVINKWKIK